MKLEIFVECKNPAWIHKFRCRWLGLNPGGQKNRNVTKMFTCLTTRLRYLKLIQLWKHVGTTVWPRLKLQRQTAAGCCSKPLRPATASFGRTGRLRRSDSDSHDWHHCNCHFLSPDHKADWTYMFPTLKWVNTESQNFTFNLSFQPTRAYGPLWATDPPRRGITRGRSSSVVWALHNVHNLFIMSIIQELFQKLWTLHNPLCKTIIYYVKP